MVVVVVLVVVVAFVVVVAAQIVSSREHYACAVDWSSWMRSEFAVGSFGD